MAINVGGLIVICFFYAVIFLVGIWAAWNRRAKKQDTDETILAGRSLGSFVGVMTLTASWVGGGYINGSAEAVYESGLVWCQVPFGYSIGLALGGIFFAKKMRDARYVTMLDPFQNLFGKRWGSMLFFPALAGEMLYSAAILAALGTTMAVMLNLNSRLSIIISAAIAASYTIFGGLAAVAYTDVVQLFCIFMGLWIAVPFAAKNEAVSVNFDYEKWLGSIDTNTYELGEWFDFSFLFIFGGIPWQVYFQRVLSARSSRQAQILSLAASVGCIVMAVPAVIIGIIGKETNWEATSFNKTIGDEEKSLILPLVIHHLTPTWISYLGLGAVSAAVMSSADSSILSSSSMFARNLYKNVFRNKASEKEQMIVLKIAVVVIAALSCFIAIAVKSVKTLFYMCGDIVYVMLFPQLTLAVHAPNYVNIYGSIPAYFVGFFLRILGGEVSLGIPSIIKYPWYDEAQNRQLFPFRTFAMLVTFVILLLFSWLGKKIFPKFNKIKISNEITSSYKSSDMKFEIENPIMLKSDHLQTELHTDSN
ncbi:UNVERIFIED_CONTAM: hypothetical protein RMT77_018400 [Armadillidium vulgare]